MAGAYEADETRGVVKGAKAWLRRIADEDKEHDEYRKLAKESECAFNNDKEARELFPMHWATVQVTKAAIFAQNPKPDVRRRYNDTDSQMPPEVGKRLAKAIERALSFTIDETTFDSNAEMAVQDYLVSALGVAKVEMDVETEDQPVVGPDGQPLLGEDGQPLLQKVITRQGLRVRHFAACQFRWEPAKSWEKVDWVAFDHEMSPSEIKDQFGIDLGKSGYEEQRSKGKLKEAYVVHEIWDAPSRSVIFVSECHPKELERKPFPFQLSTRFPCPRPMFTGLRSKELIPKPEYDKIKASCEAINRYTGRIQALTKTVKDVSLYDAQLGNELAQLNEQDDGAMVPVKNLAERLRQAGEASFDAVVATQDNRGKIAVLQQLVEQRAQEMQAVYQTLGIADIVRGATDAEETAKAQQIKGRWANVRIGPKARTVARFFRDLFRIMTEIMGEHFTSESIAKMTGIQLSEQEMQLLRSDVSREFAIDVETDSTVASSDDEEQGQRLEMLGAVSRTVQEMMPAMQLGLPADAIIGVIRFAAGAFKHSRELEDLLDQMPNTAQQVQGLQQQSQQMQQQLQQATQMIQQLQQALGQVNMQDEARKDAKAEADTIKANASLIGAQAEAIKDVAVARDVNVPGPQIVNTSG